MNVKEMVVLVTGAGSGLGKEIARRFVAAGSRVGIADVNYDSARDAVAQLREDADRVLAVQMDVTHEADVDAGVNAICERFGRIDVLISNAGVQVIAPIVDLSLERWKSMLSVHLDGAFLTARACMRRMISARTGGAIILMGSVHSHVASPLKAPYVTAKHGLLGLARVIAKEGAAHNIRSNLVCPGFVRTPLVEAQIAPQAAALGISEAEVVSKIMLRDTVDGEFTTAADVAETMLYLAGFPTNALTGQSIVVSHGWHMN
jgi:3-hydroxybutyrate dehydrogenase